MRRPLRRRSSLDGSVVEDVGVRAFERGRRPGARPSEGRVQTEGVCAVRPGLVRPVPRGVIVRRRLVRRLVRLG